MDITIFAWIFVIIFFLVYAAIQTQRCCKSLQFYFSKRRNENEASNNNGTEIYTVEGDIRQSNTTTPNCRVSLSVGAIDMPTNRFFTNRNGILTTDHDMKKDDGLPTYEEAIGNGSTNNTDTNNQSARMTTTVASPSEVPPSSTQLSAATSSPSVVINIEAHIGNPSTKI